MKNFAKLMCTAAWAGLMSVAVVVPAQAAETAAKSRVAPIVTFNRLMNTSTNRHMRPIDETDIRDPSNADAALLQDPNEVYSQLPKIPSGLGNGVAWMKALDDGNIAPRWDRDDANAEPMVMDMSVVRVPRGRMPNVVFPHRQHTEWLDCSNCHPDIFIPQKGANQISMAAIILGQKCGVCHGKVAFPVSECRLCHSQPK